MGKGRDTSLGSEVSQGVKKPRRERKRPPKKPQGRPTSTPTDAVSSKREKPERLTAAERREVARVVRGSAQRITKAGHGFRQAAGAHVMREVERDKLRRQMEALADLEKRFGQLGRSSLGGIAKGIRDTALDTIRDIPSDTARFAKHNLWDDQRGTLEYLTGKAFLEADNQERYADIGLGKAASNLIYHGETSHKLESGLEIGSMLPAIRLLRGAGQAGKRLLRGAGEAEEAVEETVEGASIAQRATGASPSGLIDMVAKGEKPAAILGTQTPKAAIRAAKRKGLKVRRYDHGDDFVVHYVAKNQRDLDNLIKADTLPHENPVAVGRALGYSEDDIAEYTQRNFPSEELGPDRFGAFDAESRSLGISAGTVDPRQVVRESLGPARSRASAQKRLQNEERGQRIQKAEAAAEAAGGGRAGEAAARAELAGELPKVKFDKLREGILTEEELDGLLRTVQNSDALRPFEKRSVNRALEDAFDYEKSMQPKQIELLAKVFGPDEVKAIRHVGAVRKVGRLLVEIYNAPRALSSAGDVSAFLRQLLAATARHPIIAARNFPRAVKALGSNKEAAAVREMIENDPEFPLLEKARVFFSEMGQEFSKREEHTMFATGVERVPGPGHLVRASNRSFTTATNLMRYGMAKEQLRLARKRGINVEDPKFLKGLGRLVNNATGRGALPESWAVPLNVIFWSPRLATSRPTMLAMGIPGVNYLLLPKGLRLEGVRTMAQLGAAAAGVMGGAYYLLGASIGGDPRSADFGKARFGDTRVDVLGGFQQYAVLGARLATRETVNSSTGEENKLGGGYGETSEGGLVLRFLRGKLSPGTAIVVDAALRKNYANEPFEVKRDVAAKVLPLVWKDAYELYGNTDQAELAVLGFAIASFGVGTQTYSDDTAKKQKAKRDKEFKTWKTETEKKLGSPVNAVILRAKRTQYRISDEQQALKEKYDVTRVSDSYRLQLEARVKVLSEMAEVDLQMWEELLGRISEEGARSLIPKIEKELGLAPLYKFQAKTRR